MTFASSTLRAAPLAPLALAVACSGSSPPVTPDAANTITQISSVFTLDEPVLGLEQGFANLPGVGFDGAQHVVVATAGALVYGVTSYVRAARMLTTGDVIDANGLAVAIQTGHTLKGSIACRSGGCLVAWYDLNDGQVRATRLVQGERLDDPPLELGPSESPVVAAATADGYLLAWRWPDLSHRAVRVGADGTILDVGGIILPATSTPALSAEPGGDVLVSWSGASGIAAARLVEDSVSTPFAVVPGASSGLPPQAAFDGTRHLIVWNETDRIRGARVTGAGEVLDPAGLDLVPVGGAPAVAAGGGVFLLAWTHAATHEVRVATVGADGTVANPGGALVAAQDGWDGAGGFRPAVSWDGDRYVVAFAASPAGQSSMSYVLAARVSALGQPIDPEPIPITTGPAGQSAPTVTAGASSFLVTWADTRLRGWHEADGQRVDLRAIRVALDGDTGDGRSFEVAAQQDVPASSFVDPGFLVVGRAGPATAGTLEATSVSEQGAVSGTTQVTAATQSAARVAATEGTSLVVWSTDGDVVGARVSTAGALLDPTPIPIAATALDEKRPALAGRAGIFLVAWTEDGAVKAARVTEDGVLLDAGGVQVGTPNGDTSVLTAVAAGPDGWLVAWAERQDERATVAVLAADGTVKATRVVASGPATTSTIRAAHDGSRYVVVWLEDKEGGGANLRLTWIEEDGSEPVPGGLPPLGDAASVWVGLDVACTGDARCLVTYPVFVDGRFLRVGARLIAPAE